MPNAYKAMDLCMLHLGAKGRLNSPNFQRGSKGRLRKKKRAKKQIFKNHKMRKKSVLRRLNKGTLGIGAFLALRRCGLPYPRAILVKAARCNE